MDPFLIFSLAVLTLGLIPGPNVAIIIGLSATYGARVGFMAVFGTTVGLALQLIVVSLGISALISLLSEVLTWLRWVGVAYLVFLAWQALWEMINHEALEDELFAESSPRSGWQAFSSGLLVAVLNPKTLLFLSAFFPQFINLNQDLSAGAQLFILSVLYLSILALVDSGWVLLSRFVAKNIAIGVTFGRTVRFASFSLAALLFASKNQ